MEKMLTCMPGMNPRSVPVFLKRGKEAEKHASPLSPRLRQVALLAACKRRGIPVLCVAGAGAKADPTRIRIVDVGESTEDPLARAVRQRWAGRPPSPCPSNALALPIPEARSWEDHHRPYVLHSTPAAWF